MATTEIYTLSLHDALPIYFNLVRSDQGRAVHRLHRRVGKEGRAVDRLDFLTRRRSEEHTSELQSRQYLVCRLLLEKKKESVVSSTRHSAVDTRRSFPVVR